jgi:uncharacterized protein
MHLAMMGPTQGDCEFIAGFAPKGTQLGEAQMAPYLILTVYYGNIHLMLELSQIEGFEWDEGNSRKSVEKHDVSRIEAEQIFFNDPLLIVQDVRHSFDETRLHALGRTDAGRLLHVSFTLRGSGKLIRVISARAMHRKERLRYEQET